MKSCHLRSNLDPTGQQWLPSGSSTLSPIPALDTLPLCYSASPSEVVFLQQVPQGVQIAHVGCIVEPHVILLQRFVAELLLKPFLQVTAWWQHRFSLPSLLMFVETAVFFFLCKNNVLSLKKLMCATLLMTSIQGLQADIAAASADTSPKCFQVTECLTKSH